jgi:hypothetical protein
MERTQLDELSRQFSSLQQKRNLVADVQNIRSKYGKGDTGLVIQLSYPSGNIAALHGKQPTGTTRKQNAAEEDILAILDMCQKAVETELNISEKYLKDIQLVEQAATYDNSIDLEKYPAIIINEGTRLLVVPSGCFTKDDILVHLDGDGVPLSIDPIDKKLVGTMITKAQAVVYRPA